jgi:hypothetical protein
MTGTRRERCRWCGACREYNVFIRAAVAATVMFATQSAIANVEGGPVGGKPYDAQISSSNEKFLIELRERIERTGLSAVHIFPSLFVVTATNSQGKDISLIVNSDSLRTIEIGGDCEKPPGTCHASVEALRQLN